MLVRDAWARWVRVVACAALLAALAGPAHAFSSLIIIHTARTIGAHRYSAAVNYENVITGVGERRWLLKGRIGFGDRVELGLNDNPEPGADVPAVWQAKYKFATIDKQKTVAAIGFRSFGPNSKWNPLIVVTHGIERTDVHAGLIRNRSALRYYLGADGPISGKWRWMADFTSGPNEFWSAGADIRIDSHWSGRIGRIARNDGGVSRLHLELKYTNRY